MELRHLRYFVGVAQTLNFRAAAENLRISAPALSRQIKDLEEEMGVRLFDRDTTKVQLTDGGLVFLGEARALLAKASRAQEMARETAEGAGGKLRVGYNSALLAEFMPECLLQYSAKFPRIRVELVDLNSADQLTAAKKDEIQLGFVAPPKGWEPPPGLSEVSVFPVALRAIIARGHPLAAGPDVSFADLARERLLAISGPKWHVHQDRIRSLFQVRGLALPEIVEVERLDALLATVAGCGGVTILPWQRCMAYPQQIVILPLKEPGPDLLVQIRAVWHKSQDSDLAQGFIAILREVANRDPLA
jgi:LysR family transcriptional regulator, benzoate and cis,cis-muconate-responsive activator of ben and cat genes